jgi:hypothetical protein
MYCYADCPNTELLKLYQRYNQQNVTLSVVVQ